MPYRRATAAAVLALAGLLAAVPIARRVAPDAVLAGHYGAALADADVSWTSVPRNIWLSGLGGGSGGDRALAAGDTITIAAKDGRPQVIEVTGLELIDGDRIGVPGVRFQMVTGRAAGSEPAALVRFLFATDAPHAGSAATTADRVL